MKLRRKHKIAILAIGAGVSATGLFTTIQSLQLSKQNAHKYNVNSTLRTFLDNDESDPKNSITNTYDANLERKPKEQPELTPPPLEIEKPIPIVTEPPKILEPEPELVQPDPIKPEPEPVPVPAPVPPVEEPQPAPEPVPPSITITPEPEPAPEEPYKRVQRRERREINQGGIKFNADIAILNPPKTEKYDQERGIANRIAYQNEFEEVEAIHNALTAENLKISVQRSQKGAKDSDWLFQNSNTSFHEVLHNENMDVEAQIDFFKRSGDGAIEALGNLYGRYFRLLKNKELLRSYVDETGQKNFEKWWNDTKIFKWTPPLSNQPMQVELGKLLLLMHIDQSKLNKVSKTVENWLRDGYTISESGQVWVNENGEWESYVYAPPVNNTQLRIQNDNKNRRILWNNSQWPKRNSDDVRLGNYDGWKKTYANAEFERDGYSDLISGFYGININRYTNQNPEEGKRNEAIIVDIDVEHPKAYQNAKALIERLNADSKYKITGYRIRNIGRTGADQDVSAIFAALPNELPLLELFFASKNTTALKYIKNKKIDELAMYTDQKLNSLANDWAFNPWALNKVAWVNMSDYNVSQGALESQERIYSRITFDNLAFDEEDVMVNDKYDLTTVNDGLRMAYWVRNNERIFQGGWGGGNKPDSNRDGNSWPLGLDFSNAPSVKTLAGMVFEDVLGNNSTYRKVKRIKLFNDSDIWGVTAWEMNKAQFSKILITDDPSERGKIFFSNGHQTKKIKMYALNKNSNEKLDAQGIANLRTLLNYSDGTFNAQTEIIVPEGEQSLLDSLKSAGFNARFEVEDDKYVIL
ncbi:membrane protein [Mycoplasmopsis bovirhinis]|uniref:putative immunoglobulin-blocking virulence protein n=1 Tax=Mycoplasmopsis bovirhinis TaxID=29553 RepID=UPI000BB9CFF0|nr:putative immunoglobulin-blocking virulence protein [Mycoplasmopsis bovirhinis]BBA22505.1 membrane protein [Mycoplasmopsis bovirhinis]